ncbi:DUF3558 domain-containing protein [Mycolicibacterium sp.]|uniref:DUF3558 domain-containing protein n=1 Tax=Mycolicibacterium sp. TaxID=2320850 RepID=UPI0025E48A60|nr:DUF3558 domain-containing protein [Mycolicibacterium sp.]
MAVTAAVAGCSQTVGGTAERVRPGEPDADRSYGFVDDRCGLLHDDSIKDLLGAVSVVKPFSGAVCQYLLTTDGGLIDVVFSWFEEGSIARERGVATDRGARITDVDVARHPAFLAQRPDAADACSATAAAGSGVLTWWVQFRPGADEPCAAAEKLLSATLSANL